MKRFITARVGLDNFPIIIGQEIISELEIFLNSYKKENIFIICDNFFQKSSSKLSKHGPKINSKWSKEESNNCPTYSNVIQNCSKSWSGRMSQRRFGMSRHQKRSWMALGASWRQVAAKLAAKENPKSIKNRSLIVDSWPSFWRRPGRESWKMNVPNCYEHTKTRQPTQ